VPKGWDPSSLDLEQAIRLLRLPREVGAHPEDGQMILAGLGRYGPFVSHAGTYANVADIDEVFDIGLNRAVTLLAEKRAGRRGGGGSTSALKDLGAHPETGDKIQVMPGRFGPYIKSGKINATLPKGLAPEAVTLEEALALIAAKAAKGPGKKPAKAKAEPKPKAAPKKKPAAKKKAPAKAKAKPTE
jgi:DNA topoisomerase I